MRIELLEHSGFKQSVAGAWLSYGKADFDKIVAWNKDNYKEVKEDLIRLSEKLAGMDGGHNKFLEGLTYWILIQAPLRWWKQMDTYRVGITKSSESTMHLSWKGGLSASDFENPELVYPETLKRLNDDIHAFCNCTPDEKDKKKMLENSITTNLPDGYLQTRLVCVNAKCLRNIYLQRRNHKLNEWSLFCDFIEQLPKGNLICKK